MKDFRKDRERGEETDHFRREDAKLIEKMRARARVGEIAAALAAKLRMRRRAPAPSERPRPRPGDRRCRRSCWPRSCRSRRAGGSVTDAERRTVLDLVASRGVTPNGGVRQARRWLDRRPPDELFETAMEVMRVGFSVLPEARV